LVSNVRLVSSVVTRHVVGYKSAHLSLRIGNGLTWGAHCVLIGIARTLICEVINRRTSLFDRSKKYRIQKTSFE
jgi:hypothetical protein